MSKILAVDNKKYMVDILKIILESEGHIVTGAYSGKECLEKLKYTKTKPDLILLDIMMPEMDGWKVLEEIKSDKNTKSIPVAMLTVKEKKLEDNTLREKGVEDYIVKPFEREDLINRVNKI
jgi:two-component system alkaline phosphatase synthesis response regulator PhoP